VQGSPPAMAVGGDAEDLSGVPLVGTAAITSFGLGCHARKRMVIVAAASAYGLALISCARLVKKCPSH
jgi:hypothetical protein